MASANRTAPLVLAAIGAGTALRCAPLIGLDDLNEVTCITSCDDNSGGASGNGTGGAASTTGSATSTSTGATGTSAGSGGARGSAGASTTTGATGATTTGSAGSGTAGSGTAGGGNAGSRTGGGAPDAGSGSGGAGAGAGGASGSPGSDGGTSLREELIDAIDDNRSPHLILATSGRDGYWFTINDATPGGTQSPSANFWRPSAGGVNGSPYAAHLSGQGFTDWGIYMGFTLNKSPQGPKYTYDARAYRGVTFWARLGSNDMCAPASECHILRFNISTRDTDPRGGVCTQCSDHFGSWLTLTTSWQKYTVMFSSLAQEGWGVPGSGQGLRFDSSRTYEVQFLVQPAGKPFDYWIDEVSFVLP
jgi:hypothetical protein